MSRTNRARRQRFVLLVVMTPHTAGASQFRASRNLERFISNVEKFRQNLPLDGINKIEVIRLLKQWGRWAIYSIQMPSH